MAKTYDPNVDYQKKIEEAAAKGDYEQAAYYEEKRNEKIKGEGLSQYTLTHKYEDYLPVTTQKKMDEIFQKIRDREDFSYDVRGDKLYAQYKDQYTKAGSLAREDSIAQAATLTGGYGNSYGQTLGQEAYDRELERLEALVPQLYDRAREAYDAEGEALMDQYEALAKELEREQELAMEQEKLDYEKAGAELKRDREEKEAQAKAEKEEREFAQTLAMAMLNQGAMPTEEVLDIAGISWSDAYSIYQANYTGDSGGKGSSTGSSASSGSSSGSSSGKNKVSSSGKNNSSSATVANGNAATKDLTNTMWDKLRQSYQTGKRAGQLTEFYRLRSMMEAQGYNMQPFDVWARDTYGEDYSNGKEKTIHWQSVLDLGYGPIGEEELEKLLASGDIQRYEQGDFIYYKKADKTPALPKGYGG